MYFSLHFPPSTEQRIFLNWQKPAFVAKICTFPKDKLYKSGAQQPVRIVVSMSPFSLTQLSERPCTAYGTTYSNTWNHINGLQTQMAKQVMMQSHVTHEHVLIVSQKITWHGDMKTVKLCHCFKWPYIREIQSQTKVFWNSLTQLLLWYSNLEC